MPLIARTAPPDTVFSKIYSYNIKQFVANLRAVKCPEETVKDIIVAEVSGRFRTREENLRPTPVDHLPIGWSSQVSESKLIERRQEALALVRDKTAMLHDALGYDVKI